MARFLARCFLMLFLLSTVHPAQAQTSPRAPVEDGVQAFLDTLPGVLKQTQSAEQTAADSITGAWAYYGVSPRILLSLLEAIGSLLSDPAPAEQTLQQPFGAAGPDGFDAQIDWAAAELRAGIGPYDRAPVISFSDGVTLTLSLQQQAEGIAVQRFLAKGRSLSEWRTAYDRFDAAFRSYFNNQLVTQEPAPIEHNGFLQRPWPAGTRVTHLAYFDHAYPTVDTNQADNGVVVTYRGQSSVQYDGHDGHDYVFPDQPIGTSILAAADGIAYASTRRGRGVWIRHANGYETVYWHLDKFDERFRGKVNTGQGIPIRAGERIGTSGKTGFTSGTPHLHFEVRRNGLEVDPYGWYGPGADPCLSYAGCTTSVWLWSAALAGEFDFTPPAASATDTTPPVAEMSLAPSPDLLFLANFDGTLMPQIASGAAGSAQTPIFREGHFAQAVSLDAGQQISYPSAGTILSTTGTLAFWAVIPSQQPYTLLRGGPWQISAALGQLRLQMAGDQIVAALPPGERWRHIAVTWSDEMNQRSLFIDGELIATLPGGALPFGLSDSWMLGEPTQAAPSPALDELAIYQRALSAEEIQQRWKAESSTLSSTPATDSRTVAVRLNASDDGGGIVALRLGIDGETQDPQPYTTLTQLTLPDATGVHTITAQLTDRAGNSSTITRTITLTPPVSHASYLPLLQR